MVHNMYKQMNWLPYNKKKFFLSRTVELKRKGSTIRGGKARLTER